MGRWLLLLLRLCAGSVGCCCCW
uniref:Uncharacterized protein n=1 Tax=Ulva partita TaxID=1605170 RepID=A0A1C9ZQ97_9CHLO|nr:hypothetical protein [Ulva partita]